MSGSPNVDPETRAKVQRAAEALHFRPNALARALRSGGEATTVGFVIGDLTNSFYSLVASGAQRVFDRSGLSLLVAATRDDPAREPGAVASMLERRIRALLLVPIADDQSYLEGERKFGTPLVAVDRPMANAVSDSVVYDNRRGAVAGVQALIDAGHRRIAFVGSPPTLYTHRERRIGYEEALTDNRVLVDPALERTDCPDSASAEAATRALADAHPDLTAVFAANNLAAVGALKAIRALSRPLSLLAFDDFELAEMLGLSVVAHDPRHMGEVAAELALARIAEPMGVVQQVVLPTRVVLRSSHVLSG